MIMSVVPFFLLMAIGGMMGKLKLSIVLILPFISLRKYSGGFHAKHTWTCLLGSSVLLFWCFEIAEKIQCGIKLNSAIILAIFSLIICSPIDSENRRLQKEEKRRYKRTAGLIAVIFLGLYIFLIICRAEQYAVYIAVGVILAAVLQIPCMLQRNKRSIHRKKWPSNNED